METLASVVTFFLPLNSAPALYGVLFSMIVLSGIGLPVPEEMTLVLAGYLAYLEFIHFWPAVFFMVLAIIIADIGGYALGRFAGGWVRRSVFDRWVFTRSVFEKVKGWFDCYGEAVVFFSRPMMGVRVAVPILAGYFRMHAGRFFLFDICAAIPWTIFLVAISYYLGAGLDLLTDLKEVKHAAYFILAVSILCYAIVRYFRNKQIII